MSPAELQPGNLKRGDAFKLVHGLRDASVQLTITSPPYNIGKVYEKRVRLSSYLAAFEDFARALFKKTSPAGSVCWQVGNYVERGEVYPLDIFFYGIFKDAGFKLRNRIIWHYGHGLHANHRFSGRYQTLLWFTKGNDYVFNLDNVRVPAKYPGKLHFQGARKGAPSGDPRGKNPTDFWADLAARDWESMVWDVPNVKANHVEKTTHPCQFPVELAERCVLALTHPRSLVLDPFLGTGSSALAAALHHRRFVGFEMDSNYMKLARRRVRSLQNGTLRVRPLGRPVYEPSGRERVARVPKEWIGEG